MYKKLRNTHLFLGLFCCLFLLMYGVSSVQMAHNTWFNLRPSVTTLAVAESPRQTDARAVARDLMDRDGLRGELSQVHASPVKITFAIVRPGTVDQVEYDPAAGRAIIRDNHAGFMGMLNRIHHVEGVWHGYWLVNVWGVFVGIVAASLIVIGATGVYLWFKIHRERLAGIILLAVSLGYSLTLMVLLRTAW